MDLKLLPSNSMTFGNNQHGNAVLEKLRIQREMTRCCDVILHVDRQEFHAHRCVLSACSPFFDSLFKASKTVKEQLTVSADNAEVFHTLLIYLYTGTVVIDRSNVSELLKLANKFLLSRLKGYCAEYLHRYLDTINCLTVLEMANKFGLESLQKLANAFICSHLPEVLSGEEVLEISLARLENFIQNPNWKLSSDELFSLVTAWVYNCMDQRETHYRSLLTWISWENVDSKRVLDLILNHPLFSTSSKCRTFLCDVLDEHAPHIYSNLKFVVDSKSKYTEYTSDEEGDKFLNLAISTAIGENLLNEPNIDKYLMDTGRELLRTDFQLHVDQTQGGDFRDSNQGKNSLNFTYLHDNILRNSEQQVSMEKYSIPDDLSGTFCSSNTQNFDLMTDDYGKYTVDGGGNQKHKHFIISRSSIEQEHSSENYIAEYENEGYSTNFVHSTDRPHYYDQYNNASSSGDQSLLKATSNKRSPYWVHKLDPNYSSSFFLSGDCNSFPNPNDGADIINPSSPAHNDINVNAFQISADMLPEKSNFPSEFDQIDEFSANQQVFFNRHSSLNGNLSTGVYRRNKLMLPMDNLYSVSEDYHKSNSSINYSDYDNSSNSNYLIRAEINNINYNRRDEQHIENTDIPISHPVSTDQDGFPESSLLPQDITSEDKSITDSLHRNSVEIDENNSITTNEQQVLREPIHKIKEERVITGDQDTRTYPDSISYKSKKFKTEERDNTNQLEPSQTVVTTKLTKKMAKAMSQKSKMNSKNDGCITNESNSTVKKCDICLASFAQSKEYFRHMCVHFPGPLHKCDSCTSEFKKIYHLLDHRMSHIDEKPFKCHQCSFSTRRKFNLKQHMMVHDSSLRAFQCSECGERIAHKAHLKIHMTKHSNDRPVRCEICDWTGKTKGSLLLHKKMHTGEQFSCQYPDCAYRTAKKSHLKEHMQYHTKSRPFSCSFCGMNFISKSHLKRHSAKHEARNSHQCPHCSFFSARRDGLKIHIKRKHSTATTPAPLRQRKWCLKKKDSLHSTGQTKEFLSDEESNHLTESLKYEDQFLQKNVSSSSSLSMNNPLPDCLSNDYISYTSTSEGTEHPTNIQKEDDHNNLLEIVTDIDGKDQSSSYLDSSIGQNFPGLLDVSYGSGRFSPTPADELY